MIEVTIIETGHTETLTRKEFFKRFGKAEGQEILAGYLPHIVAIEL